MWQPSDRYGRDLAEIIGAKNLHLIEAAHRDVGEHAVCIAHDVDVVGDGTSVERL